jgi:hypothetical protein
MKLVATLIASLFAVSAFAAEPAKTEVKPAAPAVTAPAAPHKADKKAEVKPTKSEAKAPAKAEPAKAATTK